MVSERGARVDLISSIVARGWRPSRSMGSIGKTDPLHGGRTIYSTGGGNKYNTHWD